MGKFKYSARDKNGREVKGDIEARDPGAVADILHDQGLIVVSIKEASILDPSRFSEINIGGVPMKEKVIFMRQMATMIASGLPLNRALEIMVDQSSNPMFKKVLQNVSTAVQAGKSLSVSFREQEDVFDNITLNLIEAGEESGNLEVILGKLATELEEKESLSRKIKSAMIYPVIILVVILGVILMMMFVLVPSMSDIYNDFGADLPVITRMLMTASDLLLDYWWAVIVIISVFYVSFRYYKSTEKGKKTIDKLLIKLPIIGKLISKTQIAQFTRILSLLLGSGLSIVKALELTGQSLSNSIFKDVVMESKEEVEKGGPLALPIARSEYFPLLVSSMISVGEETGEIDAVLEKVSQYYKEEVDTATSNLSTILEPLMLIIMGVAVGFIALGVYMPMFGLSQVMT